MLTNRSVYNNDIDKDKEQCVGISDANKQVRVVT